MSLVHMVILAIVAIIVIPPDKLPEVARQVARFLNDLRRSTSGVWDDLKKDAMLRPEDLMKYNPPQQAQTYQPPLEPAPPPIHEGHGPESVPHDDKTTVTAVADENKNETKKHE